MKGIKMQNGNMAIIVLAGALLMAPLVDGATTQPHLAEVSYPTQTVCSIVAPASGSYAAASWTQMNTGDWTGC
jgi:hypothetical protein